MRYHSNLPEQQPAKQDAPADRPDRPLGVTIMVVANIILAGTLPIVRFLIETRGQFLVMMQPDQIPALFLRLILPSAIIIAAVGTWRGRDQYRQALLILLTLYFTLDIFGDLGYLMLGGLDTQETVVAISRIARSLAWLIFNYVYFLRPKTIAYYRRPVSSGDEPEESRNSM